MIKRHNLYPLLIAAALILIAASRLAHLPALDMDGDEIWSVWQTFGTPTQIILWTPYDWPPLSYLIIGFWRGLVGIHPFAIRVLPILAFLLGSAFLYRVTRKLISRDAALLAVLGH